MAKIQAVWKCQSCNHQGSREEFHPTSSILECPVCRSEDCFPHRKYKCKGCGTVLDQADWFGDETSLDDDPFETGELPRPCRGCTQSFDAKLKLERGEEGLTEEDGWLLDELETTPADLEEVSVLIPVKE